jgi:hypothetical protein
MFIMVTNLHWIHLHSECATYIILTSDDSEKETSLCPKLNGDRRTKDLPAKKLFGFCSSMCPTAKS